MLMNRIDDEIELHLIEPRHASSLYKLVDQNRDHLRTWLAWVDNWQDITSAERFIYTAINRFKNNEAFHTGIWYQNQLVGMIGYHRWDFRHRRTEIGYWLSRQFSGRGIMTRCARAYTDYTFDVLQLHRLEIQCAPDNAASCAIPMRLGYTHEGVIRASEQVNGQFLDMNVFSMLATEWAFLRQTI